MPLTINNHNPDNTLINQGGQPRKNPGLASLLEIIFPTLLIKESLNMNYKPTNASDSNYNWVFFSLACGIIGIILVTVLIINIFILGRLFENNIVFIIYVSPIIGLLGLIIGIRGLKTSKKAFSIAGIILCSLNLLFVLLFWVLFFVS
jgi:hypothetical protein